MEKWFNVGKIVNTHGIRGEVKVLSMTDFAEERFRKGTVLHLFMDGDGIKPLTVSGHRVHKNFDLLTFEGFHSINDVEGWKGSLLKVSEDQLLELEENEYYFHEIIGCTIFTLEDEEEIGVVKEVISTGANDVWVVKGSGGKDQMIPYIDDVVKEIDIETKKIWIDPIEGLLS